MGAKRFNVKEILEGLTLEDFLNADGWFSNQEKLDKKEAIDLIKWEISITGIPLGIIIVPTGRKEGKHELVLTYMNNGGKPIQDRNEWKRLTSTPLIEIIEESFLYEISDLEEEDLLPLYAKEIKDRIYAYFEREAYPFGGGYATFLGTCWFPRELLEILKKG